ncbi:hypothetical protein HA397_24850, partial [Escherichia coli]|nr:hypothetical protein [Escherichia coli]
MRIHPNRRQMIALTGAAFWSSRAGAGTPARAGTAVPVHTIEGRAFGSHWRITVP